MRKLYDAADRFCARHPRFGVPDLMRYIVIGNVVVFFLIMLTRGTNANALNFLYFDPQMVLRGCISTTGSAPRWSGSGERHGLTSTIGAACC